MITTKNPKEKMISLIMAVLIFLLCLSVLPVHAEATYTIKNTTLNNADITAQLTKTNLLTGITPILIEGRTGKQWSLEKNNTPETNYTNLGGGGLPVLTDGSLADTSRITVTLGNPGTNYSFTLTYALNNRTEISDLLLVSRNNQASQNYEMYVSDSSSTLYNSENKVLSYMLDTGLETANQKGQLYTYSEKPVGSYVGVKFLAGSLSGAHVYHISEIGVYGVKVPSIPYTTQNTTTSGTDIDAQLSRTNILSSITPILTELDKGKIWTPETDNTDVCNYVDVGLDAGVTPVNLRYLTDGSLSASSRATITTGSQSRTTDSFTLTYPLNSRTEIDKIMLISRSSKTLYVRNYEVYVSDSFSTLYNSENKVLVYNFNSETESVDTVQKGQLYTFNNKPTGNFFGIKFLAGRTEQPNVFDIGEIGLYGNISEEIIKYNNFDSYIEDSTPITTANGWKTDSSGIVIKNYRAYVAGDGNGFAATDFADGYVEADINLAAASAVLAGSAKTITVNSAALSAKNTGADQEVRAQFQVTKIVAEGIDDSFTAKIQLVVNSTADYGSGNSKIFSYDLENFAFGKTYHVKLSCIGNYIVLELDGQEVFQKAVPAGNSLAVQSGSFGFYNTDGSVEAAFDNVKIVKNTVSEVTVADICSDSVAVQGYMDVEGDSINQRNKYVVNSFVAVTVTPQTDKQLKAGSLSYLTTTNSTEIFAKPDDVPAGVGTGNEFVFSIPADPAEITAEFIDTNVTDFSVATIAARANIGYNAIQYRSRLYLPSNQNGDLLLDIKYNATAYTIVDFGSLIVPKTILNGATLDMNAVANESIKAKKSSAYKEGFIYDKTNQYVDFTVMMTGITTTKLGREYVVRTYIEVVDGMGNSTFLYGQDVYTKSAYDLF